MPVGAQLSHRCTIERPTYTLDAYGQRVAAWQPVAADVACRLIQNVVRAPDGVLAERPMITETTLIVGPQTDIRQDDRISSIVYEDGTAESGPYVVRTLVARRRGRHGIAHYAANVERSGASPGVPS